MPTNSYKIYVKILITAPQLSSNAFSRSYLNSARPICLTTEDPAFQYNQRRYGVT